MIGFGSTEAAFEAAEEAAIIEYAHAAYKRLECSYVTDDLAKDIERWIGVRAEASRTKDADYKEAKEYPARYSCYWTSVASNGHELFVKLRFIHTNRRHGLSPDGWAATRTKRIVHIDDFDS